MERVLSRKLIGKKTRRELGAYLGDHLPQLQQPAERGAWVRRSAHIRHRILESFFRGHPADLLAGKPGVEWAGVLQTCRDYRIRKLRYEGYPGMWIPALLYEPAGRNDRMPAVLNPNGHHAGGKAMDYKQARCINLAKRGMLALSTEFIGMGELRASMDHNRIAHLDLCGVAGVGVFYLAMKRGLDVLLAHPQADRERVAMTGLSGGGWQTIVLAALDGRVKVAVPVAGHSPVWQRAGCEDDIGDMEQVPSDLCPIADYDSLTAMLAPRPTLLIYNRKDDCCFKTRRTRKSIYQPAEQVYSLFGAGHKLQLHDNVDPGTHNYDSKNRSQLYKFLNQHFGLDTPEEDLPWKDEIHTESELNVGLPPGNATLISLAQQALRRIRGTHKKGRRRPGRRRQLAGLIKVEEFDQVKARLVSGPYRRGGCTVRQYILTLDHTWSVPLTELVPAEVRGVELMVSDRGRNGSARQAGEALAAGRRLLVADIFGTGEAEIAASYHMLLASAGRRALGLQVGQLLALLRWAGRRYRRNTVNLRANSQAVSVAALAATALAPNLVAELTTCAMMDSFARLIEWPLPYANAAPLFCFGLLKEFDVDDLIALTDPVPLRDSQRGPLRSRR